jgi:hypothetical protein
MSIGRILLLWAMVAAARAQPPVDQLVSTDPDLLLNLPYAMRLELGLSSWSGPSPGTASAVFTSVYRLRTLDERTQWGTRFGVHLVDQATLRPSVTHQTPIPGNPQFNFAQELWWPDGRPLTGLQFQRRNFLFEGDQLSIRSTSDVQALARGVGLLGSGAAVDLLSLMGWRSHSRLVWELGEPTRELQWRFSARMDRRGTIQSSAVDLQVMRRF